MLNNKFLGLPLVLWLVIVSIAVLIDIPMVLINQTTQKRLSQIELGQLQTMVQVRELLVTPTASPTATLTPTVAPILKAPVTTRPLLRPTSTQVK